MSKKAKAERVHLSRASIFEAGKLLEEALKESGTQKGRYVYVDDWTDSKIATLIGCNEGQIATLRKEVFGDLERGSNGIVPAKLMWDRLRDLEARVAELEKHKAKPNGAATTNTGPTEVLRDFQSLQRR